MKKLFNYSCFLLLLLLPAAAYAYCPVCTFSAGAITIFALWLGINTTIIGLFIGAFIIGIADWMASLLKKKYIPGQTFFVELIIYLSTILPLMPLADEHSVFFISWLGNGGTLIALNHFFLGSLLGVLIVKIAPYLNKAIKRIRKKSIPYQNAVITLLVLIVTALLIEIFY